MFSRCHLHSLLMIAACLIVSAPSSASHERLWDDVGYGVASGGYTPRLEATGTPTTGRVCAVELTGAPPGKVGYLFIGEETYLPYYGSTLVPESSSFSALTVDGEGRARRSFVWPFREAGSTCAVQVVVRDGAGGHAYTNAVVATTLTPSEAAAFDAATAAASGWLGVDVTRVREVMTLADTSHESVAADLMVDHGALPDFLATDSDPGTFAVGYIPDYRSIPQKEIEVYRDGLLDHMKPGDTVVEVIWSEAHAGSFSSYTLVDSAGTATFDTFGAAFPRVYPEPVGAGVPFPPGTSWRATGVFGIPQWSASASTAVDCNGKQVNYCGASSRSDSGGSWEADIDTVCEKTQDGECCVCAVTVGAASGFITVDVTGMGVSFGGVLGFKHTRQTQIGKCCP